VSGLGSAGLRVYLPYCAIFPGTQTALFPYFELPLPLSNKLEMSEAVIVIGDCPPKSFWEDSIRACCLECFGGWIGSFGRSYEQGACSKQTCQTIFVSPNQQDRELLRANASQNVSGSNRLLANKHLISPSSFSQKGYCHGKCYDQSF